MREIEGEYDGGGGGEVRAGKLDASVFPPSPPLPALWEDNGGV